MILVLLLVAALLPPECVLQPGSAPRILVVQSKSSDTPQPTLERRLIAELRSAGLVVELVQMESDGGGVAKTTLSEMAVQRGAFAALRLANRESGDPIRIGYASSARSGSQGESVIGADDDEDATVWRVLDLLNARLLEARLVCRKVQAVAAGHGPLVHPTVLVEATREEPRFSLEIGPALVAPLSIQATLGLGLAVAFKPSNTLRLELDSMVTVLRSTIKDEGGKSEVGISRLQLGLLYEADWWRWGRPFAGIGLGAITIWADGESGGPYVARSDASVVLQVGLSAGMAFKLSQALEIRLSFVASLPYKEFVIRFGEEPVARIGRPLMDTSLRLAWKL